MRQIVVFVAVCLGVAILVEIVLLPFGGAPGSLSGGIGLVAAVLVTIRAGRTKRPPPPPPFRG